MRPGIYPDLSWSGQFNRAVRTFQIVMVSILFGGLVGGAGVFAVTRLLTESAPPRPDIRIGAPAVNETPPSVQRDVSSQPQAQEPTATPAARTIAPAPAQPATAQPVLAQPASVPAGSAAVPPSQAGQLDLNHLYDRSDAAHLQQAQTGAKPNVAHIKKRKFATSRRRREASDDRGSRNDQTRGLFDRGDRRDNGRDHWQDDWRRNGW